MGGCVRGGVGGWMGEGVSVFLSVSLRLWVKHCHVQHLCFTQPSAIQ